MKTLIVYSTKSGASRICANLLAERLSDCSICDLSNQRPAVKDFDAIVLGSGVRMGKIYAPMRGFLDEHLSTLRSKKTAFYICSAYPNMFQSLVEKNIPKDLISSALAIESFGGIPPFTKPQNDNWALLDHINAMVNALA